MVDSRLWWSHPDLVHVVTSSNAKLVCREMQFKLFGK
jgi:hypothetical protein